MQALHEAKIQAKPTFKIVGWILFRWSRLVIIEFPATLNLIVWIDNKNRPLNLPGSHIRHLRW